MKKQLFSIAVFLLGVLYDSTTMAQVAVYPLNNNVNDASGNGNNGTVMNGAAASPDRYASTNSAYSFDGSNQYLEIPNSSSLQITGTVSLAAWVKRGRFDIDIIMEKGGDWTSGSCNYGMALHNVNNNMFYFYYNGGGRGTDGVNDLNWHHYAVVATQGNPDPVLYIDGVARPVNYSFGSATINLTVSAADLHLGAQVGGFNYYSQTTLDDVRIYNTGLSAAQIFDLYLDKQPGSGRAMAFNGVDQKIIFPDKEDWNFGAGDLAIEQWIYTNNITTPTTLLTQSIVGAGINQSSFYLGLNYNGSGSVSFYTSDGNSWSHSIATPAATLQAGKWYHIAVTRQGGSAFIYVNGVAQTLGNNGGFPTPNTGIAPVIFNSSLPLEIASQNNNFWFDGRIDELRIYKGAGLTATQVRDWMCRKINPSHPLFSNLKSYYRFDEPGSGIDVFDYKGMTNGMVVNAANRILSGALLGDESSHDYVNATKSATIAHASGETFTATSTSGNPDGVVVYMVNERPNSLTGAPGVGGNNKYFGVFQAGGFFPQYTAVYNYTGNPLVTAANENDLLLFKRNDNATTSWTNSSASLNTTANTLTATGQNTEYVLGLASGVLPVNILSFTAAKRENSVLLSWTTASENNNSGFEVQRSENGISFDRIGWIPGAVQSSSTRSYSFIDNNPGTKTNFYRLKQIDLSNSWKYSEVRKISFNRIIDLNIYPNPASDILNVQLSKNVIELMIVNTTGQAVQQIPVNGSVLVLRISIQHLSKGMYWIQAMDKEDNTQSQAFIKD